MAKEINQIRIESILGGMSTYENFSTSDEFQLSLGIDADMIGNNRSAGYIAPVISGVGSTLNANPLWFVTTPKNEQIFIYDSSGYVSTTTTLSYSRNDITRLATAYGNGSAYYDNYVYFATNSTVARFGPLNQDSPTMNTDFWGSSLGKASLTYTSYPYQFYSGGQNLPNHVMHRHSNGKLYFADVVGNQGVLHCISTKKTTIEGDTDDGSTYNAIDFPPGMWPTAIESYGSDLAIALFEGSSGEEISQTRAKLVFWDTTNPDNYYQIINVEFPDSLIYSMKNANGVLYVFSGEQWNHNYVRISRFVGGYSFEQVAYLEETPAPFPGAVDAILNKIIFSGLFSSGSLTGAYNKYGCVLSIGSKNSGVSKVLNSIVAVPTDQPFFAIKSLDVVDETFIVGGEKFGGGEYYLYGNGIGSGSYTVSNFWRSQTYRIGQPFKILSIRTNLTSSPMSTCDIIPRIYFDDDTTAGYVDLTSINSTNYSTKRNIVQRPENAKGLYNFCLDYRWTGTYTGVEDIPNIALPITIEYELLDD